MNLITALLLILAGLGLIAAGATRIAAWRIEKNHPPVGDFADINGTRVHYVHRQAGPDADLPTLVFIHGASGNLLDQLVPLEPLLKDRAELLFIDRPGHGWSERGPRANATPDEQADTLAALMDHLKIESAIIVGHSFGGSIAAAFALRHQAKTAGLLFLAPATHPWPGGETSWYYKLTAAPVVGRLFAETLAWPGGAMRLEAGSRCVFAPNKVPENYTSDAAISLVLRPWTFRSNARDVDGLHSYVLENARHYSQIDAPTIVISGNRDTVVYEEIHSVGLARDIPGAELVWIKNLGHKPDWIARDVVVKAIDKIAGKQVDLAASVAKLEAELTTDAFGPIERCPDEKPELLEPVAAE